MVLRLRKPIAIGILALSTLGLAACGNDGAPNTTTPPPPATDVTTLQAPPAAPGATQGVPGQVESVQQQLRSVQPGAPRVPAHQVPQGTTAPRPY